VAIFRVFSNLVAEQLPALALFTEESGEGRLGGEFALADF